MKLLALALLLAVLWGWRQYSAAHRREYRRWLAEWAAIEEALR